MILVDIFIPSVDKTYDFQLDENVPVAVVIDEISEMIEEKEKTALQGDAGQLRLCDPAGERELDKERTLSESRITTGSRLILV